MYPNGRYFPSEYYKCVTETNNTPKDNNWFCNKPLSLVKKMFCNKPPSPIIEIQNNIFPKEAFGFIQDDQDDSVKDPDYQPISPSDTIVFSTSESNSPAESITSVYTNQNLNKKMNSDYLKDLDYVPSSSSDNSLVLDDCSNFSAHCNEILASSTKKYTSTLPSTEDIPTCFSENTHHLNGKIKSNGQKRKSNKGKDFCFYCETSVLNFARHIQRNHATKSEVLKICSKPAGSKDRKDLLAALRKKGNYLNINTTKKPMKTPVIEGNLLPCTGCLGLYSAKQLWRHRKKCESSNDRKHQSSGQNLLLQNLDIDRQLKEEVFPRMRPDEISLQAKKDTLICAFAARYIKIHREKHFAVVASRKMRELAKLLIEVRKQVPLLKNLFETLTPKYFDIIVSATKHIAKYDAEKDYYGAPSLALNMGTTLKQCCDIAIVFVLKRKNIYGTISAAEAEADLRSMIHLIETNWRYEISSKAASDLNVNKWNKITLLPLASDLKLLKDYLISTANEAATKLLKNNADKKAYLQLLETVFCRVILLNRRRPGELQRLLLHIYEKTESKDVQNYEEFEDVITPSEKILMKTLKRVVIRGKRGRGVPVLFSTDVQEHIKILLKYRAKIFTKNNIYLFGNPNTSQTLYGYKVLKKYAVSSGAKNPQAITSTRLRKHLATLSQLFNMTENDIEQLASFMGHTVGVHRGSYRLPDDVYQTAKISKLLYLMEKGGNTQFKGKPIEDIDIDLNDDLLEISEENLENNTKNIQNPTDCLPYPEAEDTIVAEQVEEKSKREILKNKTRVLVPWTIEQKKVLNNFFAEHIKKKKAPKKLECMEVKEQFSKILQNKDWLKIKVYIQNMYTKKTKK